MLHLVPWAAGSSQLLWYIGVTSYGCSPMLLGVPQVLLGSILCSTRDGSKWAAGTTLLLMYIGIHIHSSNPLFLEALGSTQSLMFPVSILRTTRDGT